LARHNFDLPKGGLIIEGWWGERPREPERLLQLWLAKTHRDECRHIEINHKSSRDHRL
jgi:hypothetical protein